MVWALQVHATPSARQFHVGHEAGVRRTCVFKIDPVTDKLVQKITGQIANHLRNNSTKPDTEIEAIQDIFKLDELTPTK